MKIMKRFSLILILSLLLVVGSVYAAWTYTQTSPDIEISDENSSINPSISDVNIEKIALGSIEVLENDINLVVDEDSSNKHKAKLNVTGTYTVTWTGNEDDDEQTTTLESVYLEVKVEYTNPDNLIKYKENDVFNLTSLIGDSKLGKDSTFIINLSDLISLNGDIYAENVQEYNSLKESIESTGITITFSVVTE